MLWLPFFFSWGDRRKEKKKEKEKVLTCMIETRNPSATKSTGTEQTKFSPSIAKSAGRSSTTKFVWFRVVGTERRGGGKRWGWAKGGEGAKCTVGPRDGLGWGLKEGEKEKGMDELVWGLGWMWRREGGAGVG